MSNLSGEECVEAEQTEHAMHRLGEYEHHATAVLRGSAFEIDKESDERGMNHTGFGAVYDYAGAHIHHLELLHVLRHLKEGQIRRDADSLGFHHVLRFACSAINPDRLTDHVNFLINSASDGIARGGFFHLVPLQQCG